VFGPCVVTGQGDELALQGREKLLRYPRFRRHPQMGSDLNVFSGRDLLIQAFYQRLCKAGKAKKLALKACMRKLLTVLNAMLKSGAPWRMTASQPA